VNIAEGEERRGEEKGKEEMKRGEGEDYFN
jgi:hypothetical protein